MPERIDLTEPPLPPVRRSSRSGPGRGTGSSKLDSFALKVLVPMALLSGLLALYLLWGLLSGAWSHEALIQMKHADRLRQMDNIESVFHLLLASSVVTLLAVLVCCVRAEGVGYWLLGAAALLYAAPSFLTSQIYPLKRQTASAASGTVLSDFQILAWLLAVPGACWMLVDLGRRMAAAADQAAIQRANAKYGAGTKKQPVSTQRKVFLGRCWEGPFCRDHIRVKCPVYIKRRGPCWRHKEGCMCEPRIVLQAMITPDWKNQMTQAHQAHQALEAGGPRIVLSAEAKRERCRNCVIYNEHQREKQKALTWTAIIAVPVLLVLNAAWLQSFVNEILIALDAATKRFSFSSDPAGIHVQQDSAYSLILWVFIFALSIILLAQVLKVIDYCCLKLKI
jgi:hypothetical protein